MDDKQYIHKATEQMSQGQMQEAHATLTEALSDYPEEGALHFLIAAVMAQSEEYEAAITHYNQALNIDPNQYIARFQLGLLLATLGENKGARQNLEKLSSLHSQYLHLFAKGVIATLDNQIETASTYISQGLEENEENPSLNKDMRAMLNRLNESLNSSSEANLDTEPQDNTPEETQQDQSHLLDIYITKP